MNISRAEIISAVAGALAGVAAASSVISLATAPKTAGVAEFELGKTIQVEDWTYTGASNFNRNCSAKGEVTYEINGPEGLTGRIGGTVEFEHGREFIDGVMVDGEGVARISIWEFQNEEACDLKKASDLEVESVQINVTPAIVSELD